MRAALWMTLAALAANAQNGQPGRGVNFYSLEKEAAMGDTLATEIMRQTTPVDSAAVRDYVKGIGDRLSAQIPAAPFPYTFAVIADDLSITTHEPIALPGGRIFVSAALILASKDEAELAGMMAHAMAHVYARHYTRQATRAGMANLAGLPLTFQGGWAGYAARQSNAVLVPAGLLKFQRDMETEADTLAVTIASRAGFDPMALVRYIGREQAAEPGTAGRVFAVLPPAEERVAGMQVAIQALPRQTYGTPDPGEFGRVQGEVRRVVPLVERPRLKPAAIDQRPTLKRAKA